MSWYCVVQVLEAPAPLSPDVAAVHAEVDETVDNMLVDLDLEVREVDHVEVHLTVDSMLDAVEMEVRDAAYAEVDITVDSMLSVVQLDVSDAVYADVDVTVDSMVKSLEVDIKQAAHVDVDTAMNGLLESVELDIQTAQGLMASLVSHMYSHTFLMLLAAGRRISIACCIKHASPDGNISARQFVKTNSHMSIKVCHIHECVLTTSVSSWLLQ